MTDVQKIACEKIIHGTATSAAAIGVGSGLLSKLTLGFAGFAKRVPLAALEIKMIVDIGRVLIEKLQSLLQKEFLEQYLQQLQEK